MEHSAAFVTLAYEHLLPPPKKINISLGEGRSLSTIFQEFSVTGVLGNILTCFSCR